MHTGPDSPEPRRRGGWAWTELEWAGWGRGWSVPGVTGSQGVRAEGLVLRKQTPAEVAGRELGRQKPAVPLDSSSRAACGPARAPHAGRGRRGSGVCAGHQAPRSGRPGHRSAFVACKPETLDVCFSTLCVTSTTSLFLSYTDLR